MDRNKELKFERTTGIARHVRAKRPTNRTDAEKRVFKMESLILAQDERWRRA